MASRINTLAPELHRRIQQAAKTKRTNVRKYNLLKGPKYMVNCVLYWHVDDVMDAYNMQKHQVLGRCYSNNAPHKAWIILWAGQ